MATLDIPKMGEISMLKHRLTALPDALRKAREAVNAATETAQGYRDAMKQLEAEALLEVSGEIRGGGDMKPAFSNEALRGAEVKRRLGSAAEYQALAEKCRVIEREKGNAELDLKHLEDEWRSWRALTGLTVAGIQLITQGR